MELFQKIENAVAAYLTQYVDGDPDMPASHWPQSMRNAAGQLRIFTGESDQVKDGQAILVIAEDSNSEDPQFAGNQHVPVQVWLRTPIRVLTSDEVAAKAYTALQSHAMAAGILADALNQDPFALAGYFNQGGQAMTIMGGIMDLKPQRAEPPGFYASGWNFRVYAMGLVAS